MTGRHSLTRTHELLKGEAWIAGAPALAGCSQFVGRVGALAVALGVGVAVAAGGSGVAWAEDDDGAGGGDTSNSDTSGSGGTDTDTSENSDDGASAAGVNPSGTADEDEPQAKAPKRVLGPAWRRQGLQLPRVVLRPNSFAETARAGKKTIATTPDQGATTRVPVTAGPPSVSDVVTQWTEWLTQDFNGAGPATGKGQTTPSTAVSSAAAPPAATSGAGTAPAANPVVARQHLSGAPGLRSTTDQVRGLVASATATVGTDPGRIASAFTGAGDMLRAQGIDAITSLRTIQISNALSTQDTANTAVAPVVQGPVARIVSGLLAAIGITRGSAATTPVRPLAPQTLLGVLALIRREIEHTFTNKAPNLPDTPISLTVNEGSSKSITMPTADADGDTLTYTVPAKGQPGGPQHGTATVTGNTITYTPDPGYAPTGAADDTFIITASDANSGFHIHARSQSHTDTEQVNVDVTPTVIDTAPTVTSATGGALNAGTGAVKVTVHATDPDGDPVTAITPTLANGDQGTISDVSAPVYEPGTESYISTFTYTPAAEDRLDAYTTGTEPTTTVAVTATSTRTTATGVRTTTSAPSSATVPITPITAAVPFTGTPTGAAVSGADGTVAQSSYVGTGTTGDPYITTLTVLHPDGTTTTISTPGYPGLDSDLPRRPVVGGDGTVAQPTVTVTGSGSEPDDYTTTVTVIHPDGTTTTTNPATGYGSLPVVGADGTVAVTTISGVSSSPNGPVPDDLTTTVTVIRPDGTITGSSTRGVPLAAQVVGADGTVAVTTLTGSTADDVTTTVTVIHPNGARTPEPLTGFPVGSPLVGADGTVAVTTFTGSTVDDVTTTVTVIHPNGPTTTSSTPGYPLAPRVGADGTVVQRIESGTGTSDDPYHTTVTVTHPDGTTTTASAPGGPVVDADGVGQLTIGPDGTVAQTTQTTVDGITSNTVTVIHPDGTVTTATAPGFGAGGSYPAGPTVGADGTVAQTTRVFSGNTEEGTVIVIRPDGTTTMTTIPGDQDLPVVGADGTVAQSGYIYNPSTSTYDVTVTVIHPDGSISDTQTIAGSGSYSRAAVGADGTVAQSTVTGSSNNYTTTVTLIHPDDPNTTTTIPGYMSAGPVAGANGTIYQTTATGTGSSGDPYLTSVTAFHPDGTTDHVIVPGSPSFGVVFGTNGTVYQTTSSGLWVINAPAAQNTSDTISV